MASILIRNLDDETKDRLRMLAARHRRPLEAEVREILRHSVRETPQFASDSYEPLALIPDLPPAADMEAPGPPVQEVPLAAHDELLLPTDEAELFAGINRQLAKMGLSEWALPENPPLE